MNPFAPLRPAVMVFRCFALLALASLVAGCRIPGVRTAPDPRWMPTFKTTRDLDLVQFQFGPPPYTVEFVLVPAGADPDLRSRILGGRSFKAIRRWQVPAGSRFRFVDLMRSDIAPDERFPNGEVIALRWQNEALRDARIQVLHPGEEKEFFRPNPADSLRDHIVR